MKEVYLYMFPGLMYFWVFFIAQDATREILDERDTHILQRILSSPVTLFQVLLAKMIRCGLLCGAIQLLLLAASAWLFGIDWGNPYLLVAVVGMWAFTITGLLAAIYALARTKEQANSLFWVVAVACALLGGSFFPFDRLPSFLQLLGQLSPNHWGIVAMHRIAYEHPWQDLLKSLAILGTMGLAGSALAFVLFGRQLAAGVNQ
jgi:ABC-2 type transport system permease protein